MATTSHMFMYSLTIQPPTAVTQAILGQFAGTKEQQIVTASGSKLTIHRPDPAQGKVTPLGFWKVLEKKKFHRSRKYNNAPMPFMQRLDEYGIALHGGDNPGYPASNGCVRMPMKFAEKLYSLTRLGTEVVIEG